MNVRPLHDRIIIQRLEEGEQKVGGIIIPETAKERPQQGKVIAAGTGKVKDDGTRQLPRRQGW
jgi:chaperonin GroES